MDEYKSAAKKIIDDSSLNEGTKKIKFDALIDDKNKKLGQILTEQQLNKIIPTTERRPK